MNHKDHIIRFDWAAKRLLRDKANFGVLEGFISVLLKETIKIEEVLESESNQLTVEDKYNRVDIKARNSKGEIIIVEIQNTRTVYYIERILFGISKAITEHISTGDEYSKVKKVYSISILYFDIGKGTDYLYHGQTRFIGVHTKDELTVSQKDKDAIVPINPSSLMPEYFLIRVNEFNQLAKTPLEEWIEYLKNGKITPQTKAPGLEEARQKLLYYNMDEQERRNYEAYMDGIVNHQSAMIASKFEGLIEGRAEGELIGLEKGKIEGKIEIAKKMLEKHLPIELIIDCSSLTAEEIGNL